MGTDVHPAGVAPPVETGKVAVAIQNRFILAGDMAGRARAGKTSDAHAILLDAGNLRALGIGHAPTESAFRTGGVEVAKNPAVPIVGRFIGGAALRSPPIQTLQPRFGQIGLDDREGRIAIDGTGRHARATRIEYDPAGGPGAELAVEVSDHEIVGAFLPG